MTRNLLLTCVLTLTISAMTYAQQKYQEVVQAIEQVTQKAIYNPRLLKQKFWGEFIAHLKADIAQGKIKTDEDMRKAFLRYRKNFPFTHYYLFKKTADIKRVQAGNVSKRKYLYLEEKSPKTVYLQVKSFDGTTAEVDEVFARIFAKNYQNLIIDMRNNTGGTIEAGLQLATYLFPKEVGGGIFLTRRWYNKHATPPATTDYAKYPSFSKTNFRVIQQYMLQKEAFTLKLIPAKQTFKGKVYVLTNGSTGSACEPLVYGLKQHKFATLVGETTTGGMLSGYPIDLPHGFALFLPVGDYYTADGKRIDMVGVSPNVRVNEAKALEKALELIRNKQGK